MSTWFPSWETLTIGDTTISKEGIVDLLVQQVVDNNAVLTKALIIDGEEIYAKSPIEISEHMNEVTRQLIRDNVFEKENVMAEVYNMAETVPEDEETPVDNLPVSWDSNKVNESFMSFRDKYFSLDSEELGWKRSIVEKRAKRNAMLKEIDEALDRENERLEKFKKENLGI